MATGQARRPKDRDFVLTREGLLFCVVGYLHPPDKYTAYLKYVPDPAGKWGQDGRRYARILPSYEIGPLRATLTYLQQHYPHYVHYCPVRDITFSMAPHEHVAEYQVPEERLLSILAAPTDPVEEAAGRLASQIAESAGVPLASLGVTGSILSRIHQPFSDIDLTVYGAQYARRVKALLTGGAREGQMRGAQRIVAQRWNYLRLGQQVFSIHPTRSDDEIVETYGQVVYRDMGAIRVRARVTDASQALFSPAVYECDEVEVLEGPPASPGQIVSFEGVPFEIESGDWIEAHGKLESVSGQGRQDYRVVIGVTRLPEGGALTPISRSARAGRLF